MKAMDLLDAMESVERTQVWKTGVMLGYHEERKQRSTARRFWRTALIAAVIAALMGLTAYAVGMSIHQRRQQELRADLRIEESRTGSYTEYPVPAEETAPTAGVTILSAINDGQEQRVYLNVSPVTQEELARFPDDLSFGWRIEGTDFSGFAGPSLPNDLSVSGSEEIQKAVRQYAYDSATETLTLECWIWMAKLQEVMAAQGTDRVELGVYMSAGDGEPRCFGTAPFAPTEEERRVFDFHHAVYHDAELDREVELVELELTPVSAVWRIRYEGDAALHTPEADQSTEDYRAWSMLEDRIGMEAVITFSDGSSFSTGGALTCPYENGTVNLYTGWAAAIDIRDVQRITLGDLVLWEAESDQTP